MSEILSNNNIEIKKLINTYGLDEPNFWVGDKVKFKKNAIELMQNSDHNMSARKAFISNNIDNNLKIISKFKYDAFEPWWSELIGKNDEENFVYDDWLLSPIPSYKPKQIMEFNEFNKINEEMKPSKIYKRVYFNDYEIRIGKNAFSNDILTFEFADDNDLWLHVSGVPGSHIIIKVKEDKETPKEVILEAARLAVFNSKGRGQGTFKVVYTEKRNVTKDNKHNTGQVSVNYGKSKFIKMSA